MGRKIPAAWSAAAGCFRLADDIESNWNGHLQGRPPLRRKTQKQYEFASNFRKNGHFPRADRVVRPYGGKWETDTFSPENRHKTGAFGGSMRRPQASFEAQPRNARLLAPRWASTPTARNGKRGDFSPDPHGLSNTLC